MGGGPQRAPTMNPPTESDGVGRGGTPSKKKKKSSRPTSHSIYYQPPRPRCKTTLTRWRHVVPVQPPPSQGEHTSRHCPGQPRKTPERLLPVNLVTIRCPASNNLNENVRHTSVCQTLRAPLAEGMTREKVWIETKCGQPKSETFDHHIPGNKTPR